MPGIIGNNTIYGSNFQIGDGANYSDLTWDTLSPSTAYQVVAGDRVVRAWIYVGYVYGPTSDTTIPMGIYDLTNIDTTGAELVGSIINVPWTTAQKAAGASTGVWISADVDIDLSAVVGARLGIAHGRPADAACRARVWYDEDSGGPQNLFHGTFGAALGPVYPSSTAGGEYYPQPLSMYAEVESSGGSYVDLEGHIAVSGTAAGALSVQLALAGSISGAGTVSGALHLLTGLAGAVAANSSLAAQLSLLVGMSGAVSALSTIAGNASLLMGMSGEIEAQSSLTGALSLVAWMALEGHISATSSVAGQLGLVIGLDGSIEASSTLFGAAWLEMALSGNIAAASQLTGILSGAESVVPGILRVNAVTLRAALDAAPELRAALQAAINIEPTGVH